jgi:hypothetical protein
MTHMEWTVTRGPCYAMAYLGMLSMSSTSDSDLAPSFRLALHRVTGN